MKATFVQGASLGALLFLSACGGGGGSSDYNIGGTGGPSLSVVRNPSTPATPAITEPAAPGQESPDVPTGTAGGDADAIVASASVAASCAAPRQGMDPTGAPYVDRAGTLEDEKRWVRSWIDETYLWYDEVPGDLKASDYAGPIPFFDVLKTPAVTASGQPKDRFHFTYDTAAWLDLSENGASIGYGIAFAYVSRALPREVRVAYVAPGSAAEAAGVRRGDRLITADGVDVAEGTDTATLNEVLAPTVVGRQHALTFERVDGTLYQATLTSAKVQMAAVMNVKTFDTPTGRVGYMQFNTHSEPAEAQLVKAVDDLKAAGVTGLVLDLRYNGGGLLGVANELASMIAAPSSTSGKVFERLQFNRKNPFNLSAEQTDEKFVTQTIGYSLASGLPLPQLNLSRVTVLSGPDTCSASESIVNALRGVDVPVDLVGGPTCGKPYGFLPQDNCGTTYFAIQFKGVNAKGDGDYGDGLAPTCAVADDFTRELGDPAEARLAAALHLRETGACPAPSVAANKSASAATSRAAVSRLGAEARRQPYLLDNPARQNRIVELPARQF